MKLNLDIIDVLACPNCKGKLKYDKEKQELICRFDKIAYPVEDGIPVLLIDRAKPL